MAGGDRPLSFKLLLTIASALAPKKWRTSIRNRLVRALLLARHDLPVGDQLPRTRRFAIVLRDKHDRLVRSGNYTKEVPSLRLSRQFSLLTW